jgi:hypothetical protein
VIAPTGATVGKIRAHRSNPTYRPARSAKRPCSFDLAHGGPSGLAHVSLIAKAPARQNPAQLPPASVLAAAEARAAGPIARPSKPQTAGAAHAKARRAPFASNATSPAQTTNDIRDGLPFPSQNCRRVASNKWRA